jgi:hypothetical protein
MPLPSIDFPAEDFANDLSYLQARLAADDKVSQFAPDVAMVIQSVDDAQLSVRQASRQEVMARAKRDQADRSGDDRIQAFRRELAGVTGPKHPTLETVFPDSVKSEISPTGETQALRTEDLLQRIDLAEQAEHLKRDPNETKIRAVLTEGKTTLTGTLQRLREAIATWQPTDAALTLARDKLRDVKQQALSKAGGVIGQVRAVVGSEEKAYSYTKPAARKSGKSGAAAGATSVQPQAAPSQVNP